MHSQQNVIKNLRAERQKLEDTIKAVKDVLKLPECISAEETPDIILGFEEQFYLKKILEGENVSE